MPYKPEGQPPNPFEPAGSSRTPAGQSPPGPAADATATQRRSAAIKRILLTGFAGVVAAVVVACTLILTGHQSVGIWVTPAGTIVAALYVRAALNRLNR